MGSSAAQRRELVRDLVEGAANTFAPIDPRQAWLEQLLVVEGLP